MARARDLVARLELGGQEAQKSHGLCRGEEPDVANLPAGEVYFVPTGAEGAFPLTYEDGTLGKLTGEPGICMVTRGPAPPTHWPESTSPSRILPR